MWSLVTVVSAVSPDGRSAVVLAPTGKLYLLSMDTGDQRAIGMVDSGVSVIRWSGDGQQIFLLQREGSSQAAILRLDAGSGKTGISRELKTPDPMAAFFQSVVLSQDDRRYAFSYQRDLATLYLVNGVQ